jgi:hypothetical protein
MDQTKPEQRDEVKLNKLATPLPCSFYVFPNLPCPDTALWAIDDHAICHEHIKTMADMNSDNADFLAPALLSIIVISSLRHQGT